MENLDQSQSLTDTFLYEIVQQACSKFFPSDSISYANRLSNRKSLDAVISITCWFPIGLNCLTVTFESPLGVNARRVAL